MTLDPDSPVVAYCAPGLMGYAERLLESEVYRELIEHPWMTGRTDVILATDLTFPLPPFDPDGWTPIGTTLDGIRLYTAPPGTKLPRDPQDTPP